MIKTTLMYLAPEEVYKTVKPYSADFDVTNFQGAEKSNFITTTQEVTVAPIVNRDDFSLDVHGFCVLKERTSLTANDALNQPDEIELIYQAELEQILHRNFPEYTRFEAIDFVVRQRDPRFPSNQHVVVKHEQPAAVAHSDYTPEGAIEQLKGSFPGQEAHFVHKTFDMINVWKPLFGPNDDWPLGVCDYTSIQLEDICKADALHVDRTTENQLLFPNKHHRWYFVKDQEPDDLIVFRNTDTSGLRPVGFHAAFQNPMSQSPPRASVEVRFVAFR